MLVFTRFFYTSSIVSTALAATFNVKVGADGTTFTPDRVTAAAGDEVVFEFHPKNHTLTQSTLAAPCSPLAGGGNSGFIPVPAGTTTGLPTKRMIVPDATTPLWFYCAQGNHCQSGMVFAINPKSDDQMNTFIANAKAGGTAAPSTPPATEPTTPPATGNDEAPTVHTVSVGQGGLTFTPEKLDGAKAGDQIIFTFFGGSHTVTQSTFAAPCTFKDGGADSGPQPVAAGQTTNLPRFTYNVTDVSKPLWFYCKTGNHCPSGMVFSVNPTAEQSADAFKAAAIASAGGAAAPPATGTDTSAPSTPSSTGTPATPGSTTGTVHEVAVGQGGLTFTPEKLDGAKAGDTIKFTFMGGSHTVTQSTFAAPCTFKEGGADSGPQPVQAGATSNLPTFSFNVTDVSKPLWFYCKTGSHCQSGMVFSVNPTADQTADAFKAAAMGSAGGAGGYGTGAASPRFVGGASGAVLAAVVAAFLL